MRRVHAAQGLRLAQGASLASARLVLRACGAKMCASELNLVRIWWKGRIVLESENLVELNWENMLWRRWKCGELGIWAVVN